MAKDWKDRLGTVYSTNPDFEYNTDDDDIDETLPASEQKLRISIDKKARRGKTVTLITGFIGTSEDLNTLSKLLKTKCGVGGSAKDNEIIIQGNFIDKISTILKEKGYGIKIIR
jgi:translation initiation factor 1